MPSFESTLPSPPNDPATPFSWPIPRPDPQSKPVPPAQLSQDQQAKLDKLIKHFNQPDFSLPNQLKVIRAQHTKDQGGSRFGSLFSRAATPTEKEIADVAPLNDVEKCYWSRQAFLRCLRAVKWDYAAAVRRAEETCVWRREYNVDGMQESDISVEGETGKELVMGFDVNCRPVLYMHPHRQNTQVGPRQIDFVIWCLERTLDLLPPTDPAVDMLCLCIDFGAGQKGGQPTTLGQARKVLEILQTYYCERLGKAVCVNIPQIFYAFYKLVGPFVDPVTKEKIRFLEKPDATALIPASQLQTIFGGSVNMDYDHTQYFPALTQLCAERKAANLERWRKYGEGLCGLDEAIIRGARTPGEEGAKAPSVAEKEADLQGSDAPVPAAAAVEPPTAALAAASLDDSAPNGATATVVAAGVANGGSSSEASTVVNGDVPPATPGAETPGLDSFKDAPLASKQAVEAAAPAVKSEVA
ncbi:hypothetical protein JCM10207_003136 [Rhodosporidiobolus poonsookiae]